jgi:phenylacetic acid degradation operon negative regulatory protein
MINELQITFPKRWDKKWRVVVFDIPEKNKKLRDEFRRRLKKLGFVEFQKSVFAHPHPCEDEINTLINFFDLRENVRCLESTLSYDADLRKHFKV